MFSLRRKKTPTKRKILFLLVKRETAPKEVGGVTLHNVGMMIAESIEEAAEKIGGVITKCVKPPHYPIAFAVLERDYFLEEINEFTQTIPIWEQKLRRQLEGATA